MPQAHPPLHPHPQPHQPDLLQGPWHDLDSDLQHDLQAMVQSLASRPYWRRYGPPDQVLADPQRAQLLHGCARRALAARQRQRAALERATARWPRTSR
jgi:hypothetical protein